MSIRVYIHRTSADHDKRFSAILNPATGYTVLSPFQDPPKDCCESSCHNRRGVPAKISCPWHADCCSYDQYDLCRHGSELQGCNLSVNYHQFLSEETPSFSVGTLRAYTVDPAFLSHIVRSFKAGGELNLALAKFPEPQSSLDQLDRLRPSDSSTPVEKADITARWYRYQHIKLANVAMLTQLAIHWDTRANIGTWPQRPGRESVSFLNELNESDAYFKVVSLGDIDVDPRGEWPNLFQQQLGFVESHFDAGDPNRIPWIRDSESGTFRSLSDVSYHSTNTHVGIALTYPTVKPIVPGIE